MSGHNRRRQVLAGAIIGDIACRGASGQMNPQKHLPDLFESAQVLHDGSVVAGIAAVDGLGRRGLPDADQVVLLQVEQGGGDIGHAIAWGRREPPLLDALEGVAGILVGQQVLKNFSFRPLYRICQ